MKWLIETEALEEIKALYHLKGDVSVSDYRASSDPFVYHAADGVANIQVSGPLMSRPNALMRHFGMQHTGYNEIIEGLQAAEMDPNVKSIELQVNSPGGQASGLFAVTDSIKSLTKPVKAVADYAASAAYAIAAATGSIEARGPASSFGSIGVAAEFSVDDNTVTITSTDAPDKRPDVRTEEGQAVIRDQLDSIHELFVSTIADGRDTTAGEVNENYGKGRTFLAKEALNRGMIDNIQSNNSVAANGNSQSAHAVKECKMDLKTLKAQHPDVFTAAAAEAIKEERDRVAAHLQMGEASGAMATAIEAIKSGANMTQSLTAEYLSAGLKKRDIEARQSDDAEASEALEGKSESIDLSDEDKFSAAFAAELSALQGVVVSD